MFNTSITLHEAGREHDVLYEYNLRERGVFIG